MNHIHKIKQQQQQQQHKTFIKETLFQTQVYFLIVETNPKRQTKIMIFIFNLFTYQSKIN
jgi:hypothetical protein